MSFLREGLSMMKGGGVMSPLKSVVTIIFLILIQLAFIWFSKFLWNTYLTKAVSIVKPIKDVWHMLAIFVLLKVLF
jgi:hypothetical protein|tara:strand:- start:621 stop:848 length:228 start_codon:yes stop_codon:yes gene_type:complete